MSEPGDALNEVWLRAVWAAATDAIALSDPNGRVLAANPPYHLLYGYTTAEVLGQSFAVIFPPSERASAEALYAQVFAGPDQQPPVQSGVFPTRRDVTDEVTARRDSARTEEARQQFVASVTHDIKSPLAVIKGHAQVLRRQMNRSGSAPPLERLLAAVSQIEASAQQLAGLIDELAEISGLATGG